MVIKFGEMVRYYEELPHIKLLVPSITWYFEITRHIKYFLSPLTLDQWLQTMAKW